MMAQIGNGAAVQDGEATASEGVGWSINRLARELRLDRRTIAKRLVNIEPLTQGTSGPLYDLADAARALFGQASLSEVEALNRRLMVAKTEAAELDLAAKRGELVPAADVRQAAATHARTERETLLNWPERIAPGLAAELSTDQAGLTAALEREVRVFMMARSGDDGGA